MSLKKIGQTLITKPWARLVASSEAKIAAMPLPLKANIEAARANGTDATATLWNEFSTQQAALGLKFRKERAFAELAALRSGQVVSLATFGIKEFVQTLRFFTRFLAIFLVGVMIGRGSIYPRIPSDSPLRQQLELQSIDDQKI